MITRINDQTKKTRLIVWDEENRIATTEDQGKETIYRYDDSGMRVMKRGKYGEVVYVNENFVIRNGEVASKHVFAGNTRIATKLVMKKNKTNASKKTYDRPADVHGHSGTAPEKSNGKGGGRALGHDKENSGNHYGQDKNADKTNNGKVSDKGNQGNNNEKPHRNNVSLNADLPGNSEKGIANALSRGKGNKYGIYRRLGSLGYEVDGDGDIVPEGSSGGEGGFGSYSSQSNDGETLPEEKAIFYYHGDHLGSSSVITDKKGRTYQHLEYFPYGETWVDEHRNRTNLPYKFTGKELDPETGLYYFGARYYDPRTSVWQSVDPILGQYLNGDGNGGIYNASNLAIYTYSYQRPIIINDPDGELPNFVIGFIVGGALDIIIQSAEIALTDKTISDFSVGDVFISAGTGAVGAGLASKVGRLGQLAVEVSSSATSTALKKGVDEVSVTSIASDVLGGKALGPIGEKLGKQLGKSFKSAQDSLSKAKGFKRKAANTPGKMKSEKGRKRSRFNRQASRHRNKANKLINKTGLAAGGIGSGLGSKAAEVLTTDNNKNTSD